MAAGFSAKMVGTGPAVVNPSYMVALSGQDCRCSVGRLSLYHVLSFKDTTLSLVVGGYGLKLLTSDPDPAPDPDPLFTPSLNIFGDVLK